jgi:hypothetical protein
MQRNTQTEDTAAADTTPRLSTLPVSAPRGPRFGNLPLSREDQVTLLVFAEGLCGLYDQLSERHFGRPIGCELVTEIERIIGKAEQAAKVEVLQALQSIEEAAA